MHLLLLLILLLLILLDLFFTLLINHYIHQFLFLNHLAVIIIIIYKQYLFTGFPLGMVLYLLLRFILNLLFLRFYYLINIIINLIFITKFINITKAFFYI